MAIFPDRAKRQRGSFSSDEEVRNLGEFQVMKANELSHVERIPGRGCQQQVLMTICRLVSVSDDHR
jgi:hypothetical protein